MSWRNVLICGVVASAAVVGCKVTVNDCSNGGCDAGLGTGGEDSGAGGKATGGSTSTGGSSGNAGTGGSTSTGGTKSTGGSGGSVPEAGTAGADSGPRVCHPEEDDGGHPCAKCIETKCCSEWLDCVDDVDCSKMLGSKDAEYTCVQNCLVNVDSGIKTLAECAGECMHDNVSLSSATSALIGCMRDMGSGTTQNCTNECFQRDLPPN